MIFLYLVKQKVVLLQIQQISKFYKLNLFVLKEKGKKRNVFIAILLICQKNRYYENFENLYFNIFKKSGGFNNCILLNISKLWVIILKYRYLQMRVLGLRTVEHTLYTWLFLYVSPSDEGLSPNEIGPLSIYKHRKLLCIVWHITFALVNIKLILVDGKWF